MGYDLSLVAELNLNDIKGEDAPSLDAWSTAAALTAVTDAGTHGRGAADVPQPGAARQAGREHRPHRRRRRLSLNVVSTWWEDEATKYGVHFEQHDDRYARTAEWLDVVDGMWKRDRSSTSRGSSTRSQDTVLQPKPVTRPRPVIYAGGESEAAKNLIAKTCDAYVMHGDPPERIAEKVAGHGRPPREVRPAADDLRRRRLRIVRDTEAEAKAELARITDVKQSAAGYHNYQQWLAGTQLEQRVSLEDYSVSNRGLRAGLVGTPEQVIARCEAFEAAGVNLLLLQCSPQLEEMERFARQVIAPYRAKRARRALRLRLLGLPAGLAEGMRGW